MLLVVHKDADDNKLSNCESKSLGLVTKGIKIMFRLLWVVIFRLFCRMRNRSLVSEREFTRLVDRSVNPSFLPSFLPWVVNFVCISSDQCTT